MEAKVNEVGLTLKTTHYAAYFPRDDRNYTIAQDEQSEDKACLPSAFFSCCRLELIR